MKKNFKKIITNSAVVTLIAVSFTACDNKNTNADSNDPKAVAEEHNDAKFDKTKEKDAQFLVDAAEINMKEMRLCALADSQAMAGDIKELAKMLMDDHSKCLKEIQALAEKKMVTLPAEDTKGVIDAENKINDKGGAKFDQQYTSMMVDIHKDAISKFEKAAEDCEDYEIKTFANKKLPELRTDLDRSMVCRDKYKAKNDKDKNNKDVPVIRDVKK